MSDWTDAGLPDPNIDGYQYSSNVGLVRTKMSNGAFWQRVRYPAVRRMVSVSYELTHNELMAATSFIQYNGYTWFTTPLVSGESTDTTPTDHTVRVTSNPSVSRAGYDHFEMSLSLEDRGPATTNP